MVIIIIISNIVFLLIGFFLRDLQVRAIQKKAQEIKKKVLPSKAEVLEWTPPKSSEQEAEEEAKENLSL